MSADEAVRAGQAWTDFCRALEQAGQVVLKGPDTALDRAEGLRYLEAQFGAVSSETQLIEGRWRHRGDAYRDELVAFLDVARGRRPSPCIARDGVEALRIAEALTVSAIEHRPVRLEEIPT